MLGSLTRWQFSFKGDSLGGNVFYMRPARHIALVAYSAQKLPYIAVDQLAVRPLLEPRLGIAGLTKF